MKLPKVPYRATGDTRHELALEAKLALERADKLLFGELREQTPTDLVEYALEQEPGSEEWRWALLRALKMAKRGPGRPKKNSALIFGEVDGLNLMWRIHRTTGETRPYKLAREAVATGEVLANNADDASVIKRLAGAWKRASKERAWREKVEAMLGTGPVKHR